MSIQIPEHDTLTLVNLGEIRKIKIQGNIIETSKNFESELPTTLQLFFTNTAFTLKPGARNYRTYWGNSLHYTKYSSSGTAVGIGYSFPLFLHANLKFTGKAKDKNRRHGGQITLAVTPVGLGDDGTGIVVEFSQMNTWGTNDKFFNLTFNYYLNGVDNQFNGFGDRRVFLDRYGSVAFGGGIRLGERLQLHLNQNINFSAELIDFNFLPSFSFNWVAGKHNIGVGLMSHNDVGFNFFPLFDSNFDGFFITMEKGFLSRLPFFTYSRNF